MRMKQKKDKLDADNGLKLLGRHVYEARQQFNKTADTLYRGKVLIDRQRTRDILPVALSKPNS